MAVPGESSRSLLVVVNSLTGTRFSVYQYWRIYVGDAFFFSHVHIRTRHITYEIAASREDAVGAGKNKAAFVVGHLCTVVLQQQ